jgi:hypothetical protein
MPTAHICRKISRALILCAGLMVALSLRAQTLYWDANATSTGAGASPAGTWNSSAVGTAVGPEWSTSSTTGTGAVGWTAGDTAYFSAGTASAGTTYAVTVVGSVSVGGLTVAEGNPTFSGAGTINFTGGTLSVYNGVTATFASGVIAGTPSSFSDSGTLALGGALSLSSTTLTLDGTLDLAAGTTTFSSITVTGNSVIDFAGSGISALDLSSLTVSSGTLTIKGWTYGTDNLQVTNSTSGLAQVDFSGYGPGAGWNGSDNVVPDSLVPEPGAYGAIFTLCSFGLYYRRFRGQRPKKL